MADLCEIKNFALKANWLNQFISAGAIIRPCLIVLAVNSNAGAQVDSVLLLNGKVSKGEITSFGSGMIIQAQEVKPGKFKTREVPEYRVFSYVADGVQKISYVQDDFLGNFLTVNEAKSATFGGHDARLKFKPRLAFWSSVAIGLGVSMYDTYLSQKEVDKPTSNYENPGFFRHEPSIAPLFLPPVMMVLWAIPKTKVKLNDMVFQQYHGDENYYRGYHRVMRHRRMTGALRGSAFGVAAGILTYFIVSSTY